MKIDGTSTSPVGSVQATNRVKQVEKKTTVSEADKIAVSDKAQVYQALLQKTKEIPAVREARVQALTEQIERGEFKVDGQKIADKLLEACQED
ncbi:flagellar biosynthesis anti-sigma factor FlgM [Desulfosporosinus fructosivorans]